MAAPTSSLRVVELYSGIGGMHYAVKESCLDASVVAAIDINDLANKVYKHNFPNVNLMQRNIQSLTLEELSELAADIFLMSPPCQPFTRVGLKGDLNDPRTQSFVHLLEMLPRLAKMPNYVLLENVQGFETSYTRNHLVQTLEYCHFTYQEFLLSPTHFGIPNQRLRYFLLAKRRPLVFGPASVSRPERRVLQRLRLMPAGDPVSGIGGESGEDSPEEPHAAANCAYHAETEQPEQKCYGSGDTVDRASATQLCKTAGDTEVALCQDTSRSNRAAPARLQTEPVSGQARTGAAAACGTSPPSCRDAAGDESPGKRGRRPVLSTRLPTEDCQQRWLSPGCECPGERRAGMGISDDVGQRMADGCRASAPADSSALRSEERVETGLQRTNDDDDVDDEEGEGPPCEMVGGYLGDLPAEELETLLLPDRLLKRFAHIVDVAAATDRRTRCFTKAYGHYVEGTGSMLQMHSTTNGTYLLKNCDRDVGRITDKYLDQLKRLRIRYFTPREIANLHHFPASFAFPTDLTRKQRYRCLGNSLNVHVVAVLLRYMVN